MRFGRSASACPIAKHRAAFLKCSVIRQPDSPDESATYMLADCYRHRLAARTAPPVLDYIGFADVPSAEFELG